MKPFKFFQKGTLDDPQMLDELTRATASFNSDSPHGRDYRRYLYHTDRNLYDRLNNPFNNNEMERYYYDRGLGRFETVRNNTVEEVTRRINGGRNNVTSQEEILRIRHQAFERQRERESENTNYILPFFTGEERATKVNPKWWMKIKMFFQKLFLYSDQIFPITIFSILITIIVSAIIAKILNIW